MNIAVLGYGTVGSGVVEVLTTNRETITKRAGEAIDVKYVLDLRDFPGDPIQEKIVHDYQVILDDPEIKIIVEVMGGVEPAYTFVKKALQVGKSVSTSNKELVAKHGAELLALANEKNVNFLFEASVGGGIPIIRPLNQSLTADEIDEITGILNGTTNYMLTKMDTAGADYDTVLKEVLKGEVVFARMAPEQKYRIVCALQEMGNIVAVTGDGVNDAPAVKEADIGVAMGITGTEVAKDAAGMVLADDNFATIVKAVKNGRNVYANIKRAIQFLLSGNTAGILTVLYASLMGLPVPFAAVHLLFINLLTDSLPAIALGMEPHTNEVMSEKPRPRNEGILTKPFLYSVGVEGLVIAAATVTAFYLGLNAGGAAAGQTMAFSTLCLSRLFHGFSCKSQHPVLLTRHFWNNRALLGAFTIGALLLGLVLLVPALEPLFAVAPLSIGMVGAIVGLAFGSMLVIQLLKWIRR